jgi:hypothetical protein
MEPKKASKIKKSNEVSLAHAMKLMLEKLGERDTIYLAFSRRNFYLLIFVLALGTIANIVLVDLLLRAPVLVERTSIFIYSIQLALSATAIIVGLWLFLKGINIVVD